MDLRQVRDYQLSNSASSLLPDISDMVSADSSLDSTSSPNGDTSPDPLLNLSSPVQVSILRCIDKFSSFLPSKITYTEDFLHASVGFHRIDTMKTHLGSLYEDILLNWIICHQMLFLIQVILPIYENLLEMQHLYLDHQDLQR